MDIPINGTLDICLLSKDKFGLDIMMPSTKFTLCQAALRKSFKNSPNEDAKKIYEVSNKGTNVQFDRFNSTFCKEHETLSHVIAGCKEYLD